jgi:uncharacterized protein DUF6580
MTKNTNWRPVALTLTVLGALSRLIPHPPNFAAVGATSLFAGARLPGWQAYLVPLALMAITDPILDAFYGVALLSVRHLFIYASFLIGVWMGRRLRGTEKFYMIAGFSLLNSTQFYLISNFPSWMWSSRYEHTAAGLAACYAAAIPFFGWTIASDLLYTGVLFGLHAWLSRRVATEERIAVA